MNNCFLLSILYFQLSLIGNNVFSILGSTVKTDFLEHHFIGKMGCLLNAVGVFLLIQNAIKPSNYIIKDKKIIEEYYTLIRGVEEGAAEESSVDEETSINFLTVQAVWNNNKDDLETKKINYPNIYSLLKQSTLNSIEKKLYEMQMLKNEEKQNKEKQNKEKQKANNYIEFACCLYLNSLFLHSFIFYFAFKIFCKHNNILSNFNNQWLIGLGIEAAIIGFKLLQYKYNIDQDSWKNIKQWHLSSLLYTVFGIGLYIYKRQHA